jgi:hypothetical protein
MHELNHGVVSPAWGGAPKLFSEGVASAFSRSMYNHFVHVHQGNEVPSEHLSDYGNGHFNRWLLDEFGVERYRQLFGRGRGEALALELVEEAYGVPLTELELDYAATAPDFYPAAGYCDGLDPVPWVDATHWALRTTTDCDDERVLGPTREPGEAVLSVIVDIPPSEGGWLLVQGSADDLRLVECLDASEGGVAAEDASLYGRGLSSTDPRPLPPGRYRLLYESSLGADVDLEICAAVPDTAPPWQAACAGRPVPVTVRR